MILNRLKAFLDEHLIHYETITHSPAYTAQELAERIHISGQDIAKTVVLKSGEKYFLAVLPANRRVDIEVIQRELGLNFVELADEDEFSKLFPKTDTGAMPPFGNLFNLGTYVDKSLAEDEDIYFNAGTYYEVVKMKFEDYKNMVRPEIYNFSVYEAALF